MNIEIQGFWNAKMLESVKSNMDPQKHLDEGKPMNLCVILIDGKVKGEVVWNGKELSISKQLVEPIINLAP